MMRKPEKVRAWLPGASPVLGTEVKEASHDVLNSRIGHDWHQLAA
jgi:hypothetical protein